MTLTRRAHITQSLEDIEAAVAALRQVRWPGLSADRALAFALLEHAVLRAIPELAALEKAWKAESRLYSIDLFLYRLAKADATIGAAIAGWDEVKEAAALVRGSARAQGDPRVDDWILGTLAKDAALEKTAAAAFTRPDLASEVRIDSLLSQWPDPQARLELFKGR